MSETRNCHKHPFHLIKQLSGLRVRRLSNVPSASFAVWQASCSATVIGVSKVAGSINEGSETMPKLTIDGETHEVAAGQRLVLAIEGTGVNIGHRCGGYARCTTCRVEFQEGEPATMTVAEYRKLTERDLFGQVRLSCQIVCDHDMSVRPLMTLENQEWSDTGPVPEPVVTPDAQWFPIGELSDREVQEPLATP